MANTQKPLPFEPALAELQAKGFDPQGPLCFYLRTMLPRVDRVLTDLGEVRSVANVSGRTEALSATLQNVDSTGIITASGVDLSRAYTNKTLDNVNDGSSFVRTTPNEKTGAGRGFNALDSNNRLVGSFRSNAVNIAGTPSGTTGLSNDGVLTSITVAAQSQQFGDGTVSYNSGSVDPGVFGTFYIFADDPTFAGGAVTYQFSSTPQNQTANNGRVLFGKITTVNGSAKTGGGTTGGTTTGGAGGRGFIQ